MSALLLLAFWPAVTSHSLLEKLEIIHEVHDDHHGEGGSHEHNDDNHEFADSGYTVSSSAFHLHKPDLKPLPSVAADVIAWSSVQIAEVPGPAPPPCSSPPLLAASWQFHLRAALLVRAPSFLL